MFRTCSNHLVPLALSLGFTIFGGSICTAAEPVFASDTLLHITVHGPFASLEDSESADTEVDGLIEFDDGGRIPTAISRYGISRLQVCSVTPLKFTFFENSAADTAFAGLHAVRLVPPCHFDDDYEKFVVLEYLAYRTYAALASPAIRVRPAEVRFRDTGRGRTVLKSFAYLVEDLHDTAQRSGLTWLDIERQGRDDFDAAQLTSVVLFQYMVGNTDWSVLRASRGERCCHNMAVFGAEDARHNTLVPFDFDQAGLVNPPYASVEERLGIRRVTERLYRGFCWHNDQLPQAIEHFNSKRPELEALFKRSDLPIASARKRALRYLNSFFATINNPKKVERQLLQKCRH